MRDSLLLINPLKSAVGQDGAGPQGSGARSPNDREIRSRPTNYPKRNKKVPISICGGVSIDASVDIAPLSSIDPQIDRGRITRNASALRVGHLKSIFIVKINCIILFFIYTYTFFD